VRETAAIAKRAAVFLAAAAALTFLAGCAGKPPAISRVLAHALYIHDVSTKSYSEALSVFLVPNDPDGIEDLTVFYVINDDAELFWKVESSAWIKSVAEGETWIGSSGLAMPGSDSLPPGEYRIVLQDQGGSSAEESVSLPDRTVAPADAEYPSAAVKDGTITVSGPYESIEVWVYGRDGRYVASYPMGKDTTQLDASAISNSSPALAQGFTFRLYAYDEKGGFGVLAGPYDSSEKKKAE
jgi:hypothetical protein